MQTTAGDVAASIRCRRRRESRGNAPELSGRSVKQGLDVLDVARRIELPLLPPPRRQWRCFFSVEIHWGRDADRE